MLSPGQPIHNCCTPSCLFFTDYITMSGYPDFTPPDGKTSRHQRLGQDTNDFWLQVVPSHSVSASPLVACWWEKVSFMPASISFPGVSTGWPPSTVRTIATMAVMVAAMTMVPLGPSKFLSTRTPATTTNLPARLSPTESGSLTPASTTLRRVARGPTQTST